MRRAAAILGVLGVVAGLFVLIFPIRQTESWCDPVSGSMRWQTDWPFGITRGPTYDVSPLERRLHAIGYSWTPAWQFLHNTHRTILGRATEYECGSAPPIYQIRCVLDGYSKAVTPEELRRFADTMRSGTEQEQKAAVDAAGEKGLASLAADGTGG